jgi:hypothetical protein
MAGAEAEIMLTERKAFGDGDDRKWIELMAEDFSSMAPWQRLDQSGLWHKAAFPARRACSRSLACRSCSRWMISSAARNSLV